MLRFLLFVFLATSIGSPVMAAEGSLVSGFLHPVLGFDHLLAMVAVGLLSVQLGKYAVYTVPAAFVLFLGLGGAIGLLGYALPEVEGAIALSVLALGLCIAANTTMPMVFAMGFVGFFAIFHGHAHGMEIPKLANPWSYAAGFMLASAVLHLFGVVIGALARHSGIRAKFGAGIAGIGLHMVLLTFAIV